MAGRGLLQSRTDSLQDNMYVLKLCYMPEFDLTFAFPAYAERNVR